MGRLVDRICGSLAGIRHRGLLLILAPIAVAGGRVLLEQIFLGLRRGYESCDLPFLNYVVTYMLIQVGVLAVFAIASGRSYKEFTGVTSLGLLLAWLPPVLDGSLLLMGLRQPKAFYIFFREFSPTFFAQGQLLGESVTLWISLVLFGVFLGWRTRSVLRTILGLILYYALVHILGYFWPAGTAVLTGDLSLESQLYMDLIGIGLYWGFYVLLNGRALLPSSLRIGHAVPWGLLAAIGARLAGDQWWHVVLDGALFTSIVFMAVYMNDYFDREMDGGCGGKERPVSKDDAAAAFFVQVLLILHVYALDPERFYLVATFAAIIAGYHHPALRLKRLLGVPYLLEGISAALAIVFGMGLKGLQGDSELAGTIVVMTFLGFTAGSVMKDYKDVSQDRCAGIPTAYTWLMGRGWSLAAANRVLSTMITVSLAVPLTYLFAKDGLALGVAAPLLVFAILPQLSLLFVRGARRAVQVAIWSVNAYLLLLVSALPSEAVKLFQ